MDNTATNAFLVRLQISQWSPRKLDRAATKEAKERAGASDKAGVKVYKSVLAAAELDRIAQIAGLAREEHEKRTVPWQYKGPGAITAQGYPAYKAKMIELKADYLCAINEFCNVYEREREEARNYLGDLFNAADYPTLSEIQGRFSFAVIVEPMPQSSDFRVQGLGANETTAIKSDMDKRFKATVQEAQSAAWDRLLDHIEKLKAKVEAYKPKDENGGDKTVGKFHDTLVTNLRELVDVLPSLNITNDPALNQVAMKVKAELCEHDASALRESKVLREQVTESAEKVLEHVQAIWAARTAAQTKTAA